MHIAICDDNGADRKQLERLLGRESDKRVSTTGPLYVDSYGNAEALLKNPLLYDVFYIDMCHTPGVSVSGIVEKLAQAGSQAPVVLCCSEKNYRTQEFPKNVSFLDKAIKAEELSGTIDAALAAKKAAESMIELRDTEETTYVKEEDILYAIAKGKAIEVTLKNGSLKHVTTELQNLYSQWSANHDSFLPPTGNFILNCRYIARITLLGVQMTDGKKFTLNRIAQDYAHEILSHLRAKAECENLFGRL